MIKVWPFHLAPQEYQDLSKHGGDEDWLVFWPEELEDYAAIWLDYIGICSTTDHAVEGGKVYIGAHS